MQESLIDRIDKGRLPQHIAIIMDGNGRWAEEKGQDRLYGHFHGVESVRNIVEGSAELGIQYLTLYAFSTENWDRPQQEVEGLMALLVETIRKEVPTLNKNNIRLHVIGDMNMLPKFAQDELKEALEMTSQNTGLNLVMALSYSSTLGTGECSKKYRDRCKSREDRPGNHQPRNPAAIPYHQPVSRSGTDDQNQWRIPDQQFSFIPVSVCRIIFHQYPLARFPERQPV
jgi:hypothetical protein